MDEEEGNRRKLRRRSKWGGEGGEVGEENAGRGREPFIVQHQNKYFCSDDRASRVVA